MIVNYFDEYEIDTSAVENKLEIIKASKTENASYLSHVLKNTIEYLFGYQDLNVEGLYKGMPTDINNVNAVIFFDTITNNYIPDELKEASTDIKLLIIGNHASSTIGSNIECINIKDTKRLRKNLDSLGKVYVGINLDSIDYFKYYYSRMRSYFLNVLNSLNKISEDELKEDIEKACTDILLNENNFNSKYVVPDSCINLKRIMNTYYEISNNVEVIKITDKHLFYTTKDTQAKDNELNEKTKFLLNQLSLLVKIFNIKKKEDRNSFVYDLICDQMLDEAQKIGYCYFVDNKCVTSRYTKGFPKSKENGCCNNTYKDRKKNCRYLKEDYSCAICSISCRVFTCVYLQRRGIDHALFQYPVMDCLYSKSTKYKLIYGFFKPKEKMMKKLSHKRYGDL